MHPHQQEAAGSGAHRREQGTPQGAALHKARGWEARPSHLRTWTNKASSGCWASPVNQLPPLHTRKSQESGTTDSPFRTSIACCRNTASFSWSLRKATSSWSPLPVAYAMQGNPRPCNQGRTRHPTSGTENTTGVPQSKQVAGRLLQKQKQTNATWKMLKEQNAAYSGSFFSWGTYINITFCPKYYLFC